MDGDWLTIPEAAARYGVQRGRLQQAARQGRLAAVKLPGGRTLPYLVRPADVARFLATSRRGPKKRQEGARDG